MSEFVKAIIDITSDCWRRLILFFVLVVPGRPGNILTEPVRRFLVALIGVRMGRHCKISPGFFVFRYGHFHSGYGCRFGYDFQVWNFSHISIGSGLLASHGVKVVCATHNISPQRENIAGPVTIGDNVWLGVNVTIVGPCQIGSNVILGANSFATGDLEAGWIYAGSPARKIRQLNTLADNDHDKR